jgi:hypothetical protein
MAQERPEPHDPHPIAEHEEMHKEKDEDEDEGEEKDDVPGRDGRTSKWTLCSDLQHTHKELLQTRQDTADNDTSAIQLANTSELSIQTAGLLTNAICTELEAQVAATQATLAEALQEKKKAMEAIRILKAEKDEVARAADEAAAEAATALAKVHLREHTMRKTATALQDELQTTRQQGKEALRKAAAASTAANAVMQTKTKLAKETARKLAETMRANLEEQLSTAHTALMKERGERKRIEQELKDLLTSRVVVSQFKTNDEINSLVDMLENTRTEAECAMQQSAQAAAAVLRTMEVAQTRTQMAATSARKIADVIRTELQSQVNAGHEALVKSEHERKAISDELIKMRETGSLSQEHLVELSEEDGHGDQGGGGHGDQG